VPCCPPSAIALYLPGTFNMPVFDWPRAAGLLLLGAVLMSTAMSASAQAQLLIGRIAFSDFDKPEVSVLELESGKVSRKLRVADKRARLDASSDEVRVICRDEQSRWSEKDNNFVCRTRSARG